MFQNARAHTHTQTHTDRQTDTHRHTQCVPSGSGWEERVAGLPSGDNYFLIGEIFSLLFPHSLPLHPFHPSTPHCPPSSTAPFSPPLPVAVGNARSDWRGDGKSKARFKMRKLQLEWWFETQLTCCVFLFIDDIFFSLLINMLFVFPPVVYLLIYFLDYFHFEMNWFWRICYVLQEHDTDNGEEDTDFNQKKKKMLSIIAEVGIYRFVVQYGSINSLIDCLRLNYRFIDQAAGRCLLPNSRPDLPLISMLVGFITSIRLIQSNVIH